MLTVFIVATGVALDRAFHESARSAREERLQGQVHLLLGAADVDARGKLTKPPTPPEARSLPPQPVGLARGDGPLASWRAGAGASLEPAATAPRRARSGRHRSRTQRATRRRVSAGNQTPDRRSQRTAKTRACTTETL